MYTAYEEDDPISIRVFYELKEAKLWLKERPDAADDS